MSVKISREAYASMYGPTVGDKVRLADTNILIEVEKDYTVYGEETKFGGGKTVRDGIAQASEITSKEGAPDLVLTNALVLDYTGIYKADVGVKDGKICGIGKAGNPGINDNVTPSLVIGAATEILSAEGKIVTAGGIDTHIHFISPQQVRTALHSGITTMIGGGTGPVDGTNATTCTPGPWYLKEMYRAMDGLLMNFGILGKGNSSSFAPLAEQIEAGACGLKIHEDWGSTPAVIDTCLQVADKYDVQVSIHTDTLNEAGNIEDTLAAINGRTIHTYHTEGAGGGHAPDIIVAAGEENILPASTNPTMPFTINTIDEHLDMMMVCHHLDKSLKEDVAFADSRIRPETISAEDVLQDLGVFSIMSSDSQAMGRIGETITRTWQSASKSKDQRGALPEDKEADNDNFRAKRYIAKYTINPAIAHGIADYVGSIEIGKYADLVVWEPKFFGVRPEQILKSGMVISSKMGDPNASIPTPQPIIYRDMFGAFGGALHDTCFSFVSQVSIDNGNIASYDLKKKVLPVRNCRTVGKKDMKFNSETPTLHVDPDTYLVEVNGRVVTCEPVSVLPMAQLYNLF